jgi:hypothetical protein
MLQAQRLGRMDLRISEQQNIHPGSVTITCSGVKLDVVSIRRLDHCARAGDNGQLAPRELIAAMTNLPVAPSCS